MHGTHAAQGRSAVKPLSPPKVADEQAYWTSPPPEPSARCEWWRKQFAEGWRPNRRVSQMGYHEAANFYGVYIWEYLNVISQLERAPDQRQGDEP